MLLCGVILYNKQMKLKLIYRLSFSYDNSSLKKKMYDIFIFIMLVMENNLLEK